MQNKMGKNYLKIIKITISIVPIVHLGHLAWKQSIVALSPCIPDKLFKKSVYYNN